MSKRQHGGRPSKRLHILFHAVELASSHGPEGFTLDQLCEQAQISKGGILYHFPNVSVLIQEMLEFYITSQLPLWVEQGIVETNSPNLDAPAFTIKALTSIIEQAPSNVMLERLVLHTLSEEPFTLPYQKAIANAWQEASTTQREKLEIAFGRRMLSILSERPIQPTTSKRGNSTVEDSERGIHAYEIQLR